MSNINRSFLIKQTLKKGLFVLLCLAAVTVWLSSVYWAGSTPEAAAAPAPLPQAAIQTGSYQGEPISLKVVQISVVDFFRTISELSGLNILIDPEVSGSLTLNVEQVPWDQLFEVVLESQGLAKRVEGNLVRITTRGKLTAEQQAEQALKQANMAAVDTITVSRRVNYATGGEIMPTLLPHLSPRGSMNTDARTNTLIITDIPEGVDRVSNLLEILDVPEKQVEIEARIVEASTTFARELGITLGFTGGVPGGASDLVGSADSFTSAQGAVFGRASVLTQRLFDTVTLDATLEAAESEGEAHILSKPRVTAQNNASASIIQGDQIPVPVQQNFTTTVQFQTAALQLDVTPRITNVETILLDIHVQNNVPDFARTVLGIPAIRTSEAQTQVMVPNGGTTVIGGIYVQTESDNEDRVPGLGKIPVIGNLFKRTAKLRDTREILFFITARIQQ